MHEMITKWWSIYDKLSKTTLTSLAKTTKTMEPFTASSYPTQPPPTNQFFEYRAQWKPKEVQRSKSISPKESFSSYISNTTPNNPIKILDVSKDIRKSPKIQVQSTFSSNPQSRPITAPSVTITSESSKPPAAKGKFQASSFFKESTPQVSLANYQVGWNPDEIKPLQKKFAKSPTPTSSVAELFEDNEGLE